MTRIWLDLETYSPTPITTGVHRYAEKAEILIRALALDDGLVQVRDLTPGGQHWTLVGDDLELSTCGLTDDINDALTDDSVEVWAHNSHFDRTIERHAGLSIPLHRWRDTMVQALAHSLPGKLAELCEVLKLPTDKAKDKAGKALINLFCKPVPFRFPYKRADFASKAEYDLEKALAEAHWQGRATRETHPAEWRQFLIYAGQDIVAMRECHKRMPVWNYRGRELELWHLDQQINDRGVCIDLELAECAVNAVDLAQEELRAETMERTGGQVESATKRDAMLAHILEMYGIDLPDMQSATLERRIADPDLPEGLRELLRIRLQASTTSTSKYRTLLKCTSSDSRLRGLLQFNGASRTGRWAGRLWQPQNLPSRGLLPQDQIEMGVEALKGGYAHLVFPNVMHLTSSAIRGCIVASPGKKLVVADLSNIEGRDQAWLAGEHWKLQAFRDFDNGQGHDLYKMSYGKSFNVRPEDVTKEQRQVGKVQELALGYEGGVGAFVTFAAGYGIDLDDLASKAVKFIPGEVWGQANIMLQWHRDHGRDPAAQLKMPDRTWLVCESFKIGWRSGHRAIASYWKELDAAVRLAIEQPGHTVACGKVKVRRDGAWLRIVLPSGRALCYPSPQLQAEKRKRKDAAETTGLEALEAGEAPTGRTKITYMGVNQYTRKWDRLDTYGGKIFENCLAEGTEVLTVFGWIPIENVEYWMHVWDGEEWVEHGGCIYKGNQIVLTALGVTMTPDHLVLTTEGWKNASSCEGFDRADVRLPYGYPLHRIGERAPVYLGSGVQLRCAQAYAGLGISQATETRDHGVVRLHAAGEHRGEEHDPRDECASGVRRVALDDRPVPPAHASSLQKLWRAGNRGVQALARFVSKLLGRHGPDVSDGGDDRTEEKQPGVRPVKLQMGHATATGEQSPQQQNARHAHRAHHRVTGRAPVRDRAQHVGVPAGSGLAGAEGARPVYDLMNCGPRHRFVVRGTDGRLLIVHNCCQAVARDVMAHNMPAIEAAGYSILLTVHDEVICEAPDSPEFGPEHLSALLAANPPWAPDMPLAAAGFEAYRYKKD